MKAKRPGFTDDRYNETSYYVENGRFFAEFVTELRFRGRIQFAIGEFIYKSKFFNSINNSIILEFIYFSLSISHFWSI